MPFFPSSLGAPQLCLLRGLFLAGYGSSPALDRDGNWGPSHTLSFYPCELSDVERLTDCGKRREAGAHRWPGRWTDRQAYLWAGTHGPHASGRVHSLHRSSHVGVPCVRKQVSCEWQRREQTVEGEGAPQDSPRPRQTPCSLTLPCCRVGSMELGSSGCVPGTPPGG